MDRFLGKAGELHVMAEFLERGWNIGTPDVDVGDDLFALRHDDADLFRVQVKTDRAEPREYGYATEFDVASDQLQTLQQPPLHYIFVVRLDSGWGPFLVIPQADLYDLVVNEQMGYEGEKDYRLNILYHGSGRSIDTVLCEDSELTPYLDDFSNWERIEH